MITKFAELQVLQKKVFLVASEKHHMIVRNYSNLVPEMIKNCFNQALWIFKYQMPYDWMESPKFGQHFP